MRWLNTIAGMSALLLLGCATVSEQEAQLAYTHRQLAEVKLNQGELEMAIREYQQSLELNERDPEAHFGLAEAYRHKGLYEQAETHLLEALRLNPDHADAKLNLGVVYLHEERWGESIAIFQELADDPTFIRPSRALVNLGWAQYKSGDIISARKNLELAASLERSNFVAHLDLGILLYDEGELVESVRHFDRVLKILQGFSGPAVTSAETEVRFRMAQAYVKLGKREQAIDHLEVASKQGGTTEWGRKSKEYLKILR